MDSFRAVRAREGADGVTAALEDCALDELPQGDILVAVEYSSINYKDALSLVGNRGVTRHYPHTPGIDAAGTVVESTDPAFGAGDPVIVSGYDLGMNTWGGFSERIRVPADWVVRRPANLEAPAAMAYGTAGFTAALAVERIEQVLRPSGGAPPTGPVVVSGAGGGVGSVAVAMLAGLGYHVTASTGKVHDPAWRERLTSLGAEELVDRETIAADADRPIASARWIAGVDTTGGTILAGMVKAGRRGAPITSCGLTRDAELPLTVFPFILRGVQLLGIDSVAVEIAERQRVWDRIADDLRRPDVEAMVSEVSLDAVPSVAASLLDGNHGGRTVVRVAR